MRIAHLATATTILLAIAASAPATGPIPIGAADVTISYMSDTGPRVLTDAFDYSGTNANDALPIGGDPDITYFNAVNSFGRRPLVTGAVHENESLLTHAVFKPPAHTTELLPGIVEGGSVTLDVQNIEFATPVFLQDDTVMLHRMWDADQSDQLPNFYFNMHNHDTLTDPFRDSDDFFPFIFNDFPVPNYDYGAASSISTFIATGDGTNTLGFTLTIPYDRFRNFEDVDQAVPAGLPAPFGFLEPFHFHLEFAVSSVPEPTAGLALLGLLACGPLRRRR